MKKTLLLAVCLLFFIQPQPTCSWMETLTTQSADNNGAYSGVIIPTQSEAGLLNLQLKSNLPYYTTRNWREAEEWLSWLPTKTLASHKESENWLQATTDWKWFMLQGKTETWSIVNFQLESTEEFWDESNLPTIKWDQLSLTFDSNQVLTLWSDFAVFEDQQTTHSEQSSRKWNFIEATNK